MTEEKQQRHDFNRRFISYHSLILVSFGCLTLIYFYFGSGASKTLIENA